MWSAKVRGSGDKVTPVQWLVWRSGSGLRSERGDESTGGWPRGFLQDARPAGCRLVSANCRIQAAAAAAAGGGGGGRLYATTYRQGDIDVWVGRRQRNYGHSRRISEAFVATSTGQWAAG
eukprot:COSAG02_NODE_736_length_17865_cov_9.190420_20_plen_119_part_01